MWWGNGFRPQTIVFMIAQHDGFVVLENLEISLGEEGDAVIVAALRYRKE